MYTGYVVKFEQVKLDCEDQSKPYIRRDITTIFTERKEMAIKLGRLEQVQNYCQDTI